MAVAYAYSDGDVEITILDTITFLCCMRSAALTAVHRALQKPYSAAATAAYDIRLAYGTHTVPAPREALTVMEDALTIADFVDGTPPPAGQQLWLVITAPAGL